MVGLRFESGITPARVVARDVEQNDDGATLTLTLDDLERRLPHTMSGEDVDRYTEILGEVKARLKVVVGLLASDPLSVFDLESAALQLRLIIETMFLSAYITNRSAIADLTESLESGAWRDAKKQARKVNPRHWPLAVVPTATGFGEAEQALTAADAGQLWAELSGRLLHRENPLLAPSSGTDRLMFLMDSTDRVINQLADHQLWFNGVEGTVIASMWAGENGEQVRVLTLGRTLAADRLVEYVP